MSVCPICRQHIEANDPAHLCPAIKPDENRPYKSKQTEIEELRARVAELEGKILAYRSEMENPVKDPVMVQTRRRQLFSTMP